MHTMHSDFLGGKKNRYLILTKMELRPPFEIYFFIIFGIQIPFLKSGFQVLQHKRDALKLQYKFIIITLKGLSAYFSS